ncbi:MAG: hypothetical protein QOI09_2173, partial [Chloroflexota bacterium]|nr:hypothetical protein [Chloroflexota bacterium]
MVQLAPGDSDGSADSSGSLASSLHWPDAMQAAFAFCFAASRSDFAWL